MDTLLSERMFLRILQEVLYHDKGGRKILVRKQPKSSLGKHAVQCGIRRLKHEQRFLIERNFMILRFRSFSYTAWKTRSCSSPSVSHRRWTPLPCCALFSRLKTKSDVFTGRERLSDGEFLHRSSLLALSCKVIAGLSVETRDDRLSLGIRLGRGTTNRRKIRSATPWDRVFCLLCATPTRLSTTHP